MSTPGPFLIANLAVLSEHVMHGDGTTFNKGIPTLYDYEGVDFGERFNAALAAIGPTGGSLYIPPGEYVTATEPRITAATKGLAVFAHGVTIKTVGAISGLHISTGSTVRAIDIYGLHVDQVANATALYGINIERGRHVHLHSCAVFADGVPAAYAGIRVANSDPADNSSGSFWTKIYNPMIRRSTDDMMPIGILLEGAANATSIFGGSINAGIAIAVRNHSGQTYVANAVLLDGVGFEGYTTAVEVSGATTSSLSGFRFVNNRFEAGTTVFSFVNVTTQPSVPPYLSGNFIVSDAGVYLNNPNALRVNSLDMSITPSISGVGMTWIQDTLIKATAGANHPLTVRTSGGSRGIKLENSSSDAICQLLWTGTGKKGELRGYDGGVANLSLTGVSGINGSGAAGVVSNLRGSTTFATAGTKAVTFSVAELDALYRIVVTGNVNETFWVTSKATTGFTINSSNASSTAVVDWILIR